MESFLLPSDKAREVPVNFVRDDGLVPEPKERITTTDEHGRAPRNRGTRHIDFVDDGKLFEGHFTVQATNLKSIIQYLLDRHNEQDVVIQDLQKQVHMLRSRSLKSGKRGGGMESGVLAGDDRPTSNGGISTADMNKRLRGVEQFLQLWGVRLSEVADLVEEYGDPTITPDVYTSYLLDLPAFRLTRREARALIASVGQPTAASVNTAAASDTATRRRVSTSKREAGSAAAAAAAASAAAAAASSAEERPRSVTPERRSRKPADEDDTAGTTIDRANAALEKAEMLLAELHSVAPRSASQAPARKPKRLEQPAKSAAGGAIVDAEARADIEELGEYVMQRFEELEARTAMALRAPASSAGHADRSAPHQASGGSGKKGAAAAAAVSSSPPRGGGGRAEEFVDAVAREDAATSLDLLEELEATMERRFKELNSAVANVAARAAALSKNGNSSSGGGGGNHDGDRSQHRNTSPAASTKASPQSATADARRAKEQSAAAEDAAEEAPSRTSSASAKKATTPSRKAVPASSETSTLIPVLPTAPAQLIDQTARDEAVALTERVNDLEEELLDRWQAMEERLRIIGRAAMKQGLTNAAGGAGMGSRAPVVDRKAREDAAMSLMRLQQVEKDLSQLKRRAAVMPLYSTAAPAEGAMALPAVMASPELTQPLRDTYDSKVADLEREVEQRMAEVNQAIAQLRGTGTPLSLSPQKRATEAPITVPTLHPQAAAPTESTAPPPTAGQLTLHSGGDSDAASMAEPAASTSAEAEERRRAAQQALLGLAYSVDDDRHPYSDFPRTSVRVGGRRTTISRLRSPDAPPFGSHLVQREVIDIPLVVERTAAGDGAEGSAALRDGAAAATTPVRAARRVSMAKGELPTHGEDQAHPRSPPRNAKAGGDAARVSVS